VFRISILLQRFGNSTTATSTPATARRQQQLVSRLHNAANPSSIERQRKRHSFFCFITLLALKEQRLI